ncbi:transcriptional regulator, PadR family [Paenibacillaceae bacterium GAS479]|nr:transcriptional regulator, PadR family [Paenibacillaceae bacterium GAS479]
MSSTKFVLLSLLAREPLSGYDMKLQMKNRVDFFYKINNNQLYPTLSKLEEEGFVQLQAYERESYRPARKVYKITDAGIECLKDWVKEPGSWEEFLLKQYSSWLVEPEILIPILEEKKREQEQILAEFKGKTASFREQNEQLTSDHPFFSSTAVLEMGYRLGKCKIEWCDTMIDWLKKGEI